MTNDRGASLLFFFSGIYGLIFSVHLPMGRWNEPGPGVFPVTLSILLLVSGIAWFICGGRWVGDKEKAKKRSGYVTVNNLPTPLKIVVLTGLFILTFHWIGYLVGSSLYIFVLLFWVSRYRVAISIPLALVIGVGSWLSFGKILMVPLPKGLLSF